MRPAERPVPGAAPARAGRAAVGEGVQAQLRRQRRAQPPVRAQGLTGRPAAASARTRIAAAPSRSGSAVTRASAAATASPVRPASSSAAARCSAASVRNPARRATSGSTAGWSRSANGRPRPQRQRRVQLGKPARGRRRGGGTAQAGGEPGSVQVLRGELEAVGPRPRSDRHCPGGGAGAGGPRWSGARRRGPQAGRRPTRAPRGRRSRPGCPRCRASAASSRRCRPLPTGTTAPPGPRSTTGPSTPTATSPCPTAAIRQSSPCGGPDKSTVRRSPAGDRQPTGRRQGAFLASPP